MNLIKQGFNDFIASDICLSWQRLATPLCQADRSSFQSLEVTENYQYCLIVFDGVIQINFGQQNVPSEQSEQKSFDPSEQKSFDPSEQKSFDPSDQNSDSYVILNAHDLLFLSGQQIVRFFARSAWTALVLIMKIKCDKQIEEIHETIRFKSIASVGNIGVWRSLSQPVQEKMCLDLIGLLIGQSNTWLGANYMINNKSFRLISIKGDSIKRLVPLFQNAQRLFLIGLTGSVKIQNNLGFSDWLNVGSVAILQGDSTIYWRLEIEPNAHFLLLDLNQTSDSLLNGITLHQSVWNELFQIQGLIWSRISWPLLRGAGIKFE